MVGRVAIALSNNAGAAIRKGEIMLNWYEEQIRSEEMSRELARGQRVREALAGRPRCVGRFDRTLAWLGHGLVAAGQRLQQRVLTDAGSTE
jgi:hypothetical protein